MDQGVAKIKKDKKITWKEIKRQKFLLIVSFFMVVYGIVFYYWPLTGWLMAFQNYKPKDGLLGSKFVGLAKFQFLFEDVTFLRVIRNTFCMGVLNLVTSTVMAILFAILLNEIRSTIAKKTVQTISYLPHFLSWVVLGGILTTWLGETGLLNELLIKFGFLEKGVTFLAYPKYFWGIVIVSDLWKELGWSAIIYLAAISGIDQEMYEAARVDGASRWKQIWSITLPSIASTITIMFILQVGGLLNSNFDQILVLNNPLNNSRSNVIDIYTYTTAMRGMRYSFSTAIGLFKSVIGFGLLFMANQITKKLNDTSLF